MDLKGFDFLDFGASKGGCIEFAKARLGGANGIGVDIDPRKVAQMRTLGYDCLEGDVTQLDLPENSVRFATMSHVLEHLPDLDAVRRALISGARVASDFLFIQGPFFDADRTLASDGLKFYWSDWSGHKCHLTTAQLCDVLEALALPNYVCMGRLPVTGSDDSAIHPLDSGRNEHEYRPGVHPPKPKVQFVPPRYPAPVYREMVCVVRLRDFRGWRGVVAARKGCELIASTVPVDEGSRRKWLRRSRDSGGGR